MKVLMCLDFPIDSIGGAQLSVRTLCDGLIKEGYEIVVVCPKLKHPEKNSYNVKEYTSAYKFNIKELLHLAYFIWLTVLKEKPDTIHTHMSFSTMAVGIITCFLKRKTFEIIVTDRGLCKGYSRYSKVLLKKCIKRAKYLVCTTKTNRDDWESEINLKKTVVIPNTITIDFYNALCKEDNSNNSNDNKITIGFAGRTSEEKNWGLALRICDEIFRENLQREVFLKFAFSFSSSNEEENLKQLISEVERKSYRKFIEYEVNLNQTQMVKFYRSVDVFVLTSRFESFGKTAIEAMACKCVVFGTNVGGLPDVIGDKDFVYCDKDISKILEYIKKSSLKELDNDKEKFENRFKSEFEPRVCIDQYSNLYRKTN